MRRFNSGPRLQFLLLGQQRDTLSGRATVSENVSKFAPGTTTPPEFVDTPLKLARYPLTRSLGMFYDSGHHHEATFHPIPESNGFLLPR
jgi:hypothetical protein